MEFVCIFMLAAIAEAVWETLKMVWQGGKFSVDRAGALVVGITIAIASGTDIMAILGLPMKLPYSGMILTGILISRGSNFVHDLLDSLGQIKSGKGR